MSMTVRVTIGHIAIVHGDGAGVLEWYFPHDMILNLSLLRVLVAAEQIRNRLSEGKSQGYPVAGHAS